MMLKTLSVLGTIKNSILSSVRYYPCNKLFYQYLQNLPTTKYTKLDNGLMIATEERRTCSAGVGLFVDGGARYEDYFESGVSSFFEHLAYKGTCCKARSEIETLMMNTGAKFKSFTTREIAGYYVDCLPCDVTCAIDIITNSVFFNGLFECEIEYQKNIVLKELQKYDTDTNILLDEYLHATAFQGTKLENRVLGCANNVEKFNQQVIGTYLNKNFHPSYSVLAVVGPVNHEQIVNYIQNCTRVCETRIRTCRTDAYYRYSGSEVRFRNDTYPFCNVAIAVEGPAFWNEDSIAMELAATLVGGWDKSQPWGKDSACVLAQAASTENICEAFKSFNINYKETGLWGVQFLGRSLDLENMLYNIQNEWMRLCNMLTDSELDRAKNELKVKTLSKTESVVSSCLDLGRWVIHKGYRPSLHERLTTIDRYKAEKMMAICTKYIYDKCPAVAAVGACEGLPEYTRIRAGMYWLRL